MIGIWADFWWLVWLLARVKKADQFRCVSVLVVVLDCCKSWCHWRICLWREVVERWRKLVLLDLTIWKGLLQLYGGEMGCYMVEREFGTGKEVGVWREKKKTKQKNVLVIVIKPGSTWRVDPEPVWPSDWTSSGLSKNRSKQWPSKTRSTRRVDPWPGRDPAFWSWVCLRWLQIWVWRFWGLALGFHFFLLTLTIDDCNLKEIKG